jgi:hypothetical protein
MCFTSEYAFNHWRRFDEYESVDLVPKLASKEEGLLR